MYDIAATLRSLAAGLSIVRDGNATVQPGELLNFELTPRSFDVRLPTILDAPLSLSFVSKAVRFVDALMPPAADKIEMYVNDSTKVLGGQPVANVQIPLPGPSLPGSIPPTTQINVAEAIGIALAEAVGIGITTVTGTVTPPVVTTPVVTSPNVAVPQVAQTVTSTPVTGPTPIVGSPQLTPAAPVAGDALSGVPGLLGRLVGTVPLLVTLPVSVSVAWTIIDEATNIPANNDQVELRSGTDAPDLQFLFKPIFTELTDLVVPVVARFQVRAKVTLSLGSVTVTQDLPPVTVLVPQVPVSTIAILYQFTDFGGYTLVFVPANSPIDPLFGPQTAVQNAIDTLRNALAPLLSTQPVLGFLLNNLTNYFASSRNIIMVKGDTIDNLQTLQLRGYNFFEDGFNFEGPRAEDMLNSLILIGRPGRELRCFNARSRSNAQGQVVFRTGPEMIVKVRNLSDPAPGRGALQTSVNTVPAGRMVVTSFVPPMGSRAPEPHAIVAFGSELSSLEFAG
jgi:hypothetical protein